MTRRTHPAPAVIARYLHRLADYIDDAGPKAIERSQALAARGWPETVGGGGSRSADSTSSTERAALQGATSDAKKRETTWDPGPWVNIDEQLATDLRLLWYAATVAESRMAKVLSCASDDDPLPAGTGHCKRCNKFCRPTKLRPHNRLISLWCPACRTGWYRWRADHPYGTPADYDRTFKENVA